MKGCPEVVHSTGRLRKNFMYRQFFSRIAVVQEGKDPLPRCELCGMHMPAGRLINHQRKRRCDRNTQIRWRSRDVAISIQCAEASFILTGEYNVEYIAEYIEVVETFKYIGRILYQSDDDWPAVRRNFRKAQQVWISLGKLLRREGEYPQLS